MADTADSIFLDANILLEIIHEREHFDDAVAYVRAHAGQLCISALTVHLVIYFGSKITEVKVLRQFLSDYRVLPVSAGDIDWAFDHIRGGDFEDALQVACAVNGGCTRFVTLNTALVRRYKETKNLTFAGL